MSKDIKNIWNAYQIINEISQRDMDLVKYDRDISELPFENIFGNKLRVVIPIGLGENSDSFFDSLIFNIEGSITHDKFKAKFPNILKYIRFDYKTKKAIVKIKTQMGEKDREETLASLVDKIFKADLFTKEYRDKSIKWIEQNVSQILPSSYVVLSRSVIDNLRMSDISEIESCHSPGGMYYSSCLSEAAGGGVVAFIIDGGELKKRQIENIETDEEIFSDKDRSVEGLDATYRLRMRKYYSEEIGYFVLPETKVYQKSPSKRVGNSTRVPGLIEVIKDFLKTKQDLDKDSILQLFEDKEIVRKGGSYEDTADSFLFNQYFDTRDFKGYISHEEEQLDDEESEQAQTERRYDQFQHELGDFLTNSGVRESKHANSGFDVRMTDDGDEVYYYAWGGISIDVDDIELIDYDGTEDELTSLDDKDELNRLLRSRTDYKWDKITERKTRFYRELIHRLKKIKVDYDDILGVEYSGNGYNISINAFLTDYNFEDGRTSHDVDNYPHFLRLLMEWDAKYDQIKTAVVQALSIAGYADLTENQKIQYGLMAESERTFTHKPGVHTTKYTPKNLKFQGDWAYFYIQTGINSTYLYSHNFEEYGNNRELKTKIWDDIKTALNKFITEKIHYYETQHEKEYEEDLRQNQFNLENYNFEFETYVKDKTDRYIHLDIKIEDATDRSSLDQTGNGLVFKVSIETEDRNTLVIKTIDNSINDIRNLITCCLIQNIKPEDKLDFHDRNLLKTYNHYLNITPITQI